MADINIGKNGNERSDSGLILLEDKAISEIVITHHAQKRWADRVESDKTGFRDITAFLWNKLKAQTIRAYYKREQDVYVIDEDLVMVAEFAPADSMGASPSIRAYKMIVVTFLGRMSETMELRDLRSYYSWLRHSRRMTLIKSGRKRR